jgi:hypothetical protein
MMPFFGKGAVDLRTEPGLLPAPAEAFGQQELVNARVLDPNALDLVRVCL